MGGSELHVSSAHVIHNDLGISKICSWIGPLIASIISIGYVVFLYFLFNILLFQGFNGYPAAVAC